MVQALYLVSLKLTLEACQTEMTRTQTPKFNFLSRVTVQITMVLSGPDRSESTR
jgi:hypothetical protein